MESKQIIFVLFSFLFIATISCHNVPNDKRFPSGGTMSPYRLPNTTIPKLYNVIITADPNQKEYFTGYVKIVTRALIPTNKIVIHAKYLEIDNVTVKMPNGRDNLCNGWTVANNDTDFLELHLVEDLIPEFDYIIRISYVGHYAENKRGFFINSYLDDDDNTRNFATTHLEPIGARRTFPCYDEPALKAIIRIQTYTPPEYTTISNTEERSTKLPKKDGYRATTFRLTPPMPCYLVVILISDFKRISNVIDGPMIHPKKFSVYSRPNAQNADFALVKSQVAMLAMESYTNSSYIMNKMDIAIIPDFSILAMENLGLMLFRESVILIGPKSTTSEKQRASMLFYHETSHMWFGNKVTLVWWDYYWLNEGFANYFQHYLLNSINNGEYRLMEQFVVNTLQVIMDKDSSVYTHAMSEKVHKNGEIRRNMDRVTYDKGASVLRMMSHVLGEDIFRDGLIRYLSSLINTVTEPSKLYAALQYAVDSNGFLPSEITVEEIFDSWATQRGYPVVEAIRSKNKQYIKITQSRYHGDIDEHTDEKWWIPLTWATDLNPSFDNTKVQGWMSPKSTSKIIEIDRDAEWFILNKQQIGYFRVLYSEDNWNQLIRALTSQNFGEIHCLNRANLVDDSFEFARAERMSYNTALDLLSYLKYEVDYIPWISANRGFQFLSKMMTSSKYYDLFKTFLLSLIDKSYEYLGFICNRNDDHISKLHRVLSVSMACGAGSDDCLSKANDILTCHMSDGNCCEDPDLILIIYCYGIRYGTNDHWDYLWKKYLNEKSYSQRIILIQSLSFTESPAILKRYLNMIISKHSKLRNEDRENVLHYIIDSGPLGLSLALNFISKNFKKLQEILSTTTQLLFLDIGNNIIKSTDLDIYKKFIDDHKSMFTRLENYSIYDSLITINENMDWIKTSMDEIDTWLVNNIK